MTISLLLFTTLPLTLLLFLLPTHKQKKNTTLYTDHALVFYPGYVAHRRRSTSSTWNYTWSKSCIQPSTDYAMSPPQGWTLWQLMFIILTCFLYPFVHDHTHLLTCLQMLYISSSRSQCQFSPTHLTSHQCSPMTAYSRLKLICLTYRIDLRPNCNYIFCMESFWSFAL